MVRPMRFVRTGNGSTAE